MIETDVAFKIHAVDTLVSTLSGRQLVKPQRASSMGQEPLSRILLTVVCGKS